MNLDDPVAVALRVAALLERAETPYALYGGLAVAAYGAPRETKDADLAVVAADAGALAELLGRDGVRATVAFERVRFGGLWIGRVTLLGGPDEPGLNTVDLVEPASPAMRASRSSARCELHCGTVRSDCSCPRTWCCSSCCRPGSAISRTPL